jgi:hypothetical protein
MAARYGVGRGSTGAKVAVVVLVAAFLAAAGYVTWRLASPSTQSTLLRFTVVDDTRVDIVFEVQRADGAATQCVLRAQDEQHADVGYATVTITRGKPVVEATYPLATYARATAAEVLGCEVGGPPRVQGPQFPPGTTNPAQIPTIDGS